MTSDAGEDAVLVLLARNEGWTWGTVEKLDSAA
jgi:hypothetical protein